MGKQLRFVYQRLTCAQRAKFRRKMWKGMKGKKFVPVHNAHISPDVAALLLRQQIRVSA